MSSGTAPEPEWWCPLCGGPPYRTPNPDCGRHFCEDCNLFFNGGADEWLSYEKARNDRARLLAEATERQAAAVEHVVRTQDADLLGGLRSAEDLMASSFSYEDALEDLCHLVDSGDCTPNCLFAVDTGHEQCECRCMGVFHGQARWRPSTRA